MKPTFWYGPTVCDSCGARPDALGWLTTAVIGWAVEVVIAFFVLPGA